MNPLGISAGLTVHIAKKDAIEPIEIYFARSDIRAERLLTRQEACRQELSQNSGSLQDAPALRRCFRRRGPSTSGRSYVRKKEKQVEVRGPAGYDPSEICPEALSVGDTR
jgi:hypothetical protein